MSNCYSADTLLSRWPESAYGLHVWVFFSVQLWTQSRIVAHLQYSAVASSQDLSSEPGIVHFSSSGLRVQCSLFVSPLGFSNDPADCVHRLLNVWCTVACTQKFKVSFCYLYKRKKKILNHCKIIWFVLHVLASCFNLSRCLSARACVCVCLCIFLSGYSVCVYPSAHSLSPSLLPSVPLIPECVTNGRSRCSALLCSASGDPSSVCVCAWACVRVHIFLSWGA